MNKELWEMTFNQYCENFLNTNRYAKKYKENPTMWEGKKQDLLESWWQLLQDRAEIGDIPEIVIRSAVNIFGESKIRRIFRGTKEKGLQSWEQTQQNKVYREDIIDNLRQCENNLKSGTLGC